MIEMFDVMLLSILPGMVGGLIRGATGISKNVVVGKKAMNLPRLLYTIMISIVVGAIAGTLTGGDWRIALLAGYAGSDLLEALYKTRLLKLFKTF